MKALRLSAAAGLFRPFLRPAAPVENRPVEPPARLLVEEHGRRLAAPLRAPLQLGVGLREGSGLDIRAAQKEAAEPGVGDRPGRLDHPDGLGRLSGPEPRLGFDQLAVGPRVVLEALPEIGRDLECSPLLPGREEHARGRKEDVLALDQRGRSIRRRHRRSFVPAGELRLREGDELGRRRVGVLRLRGRRRPPPRGSAPPLRASRPRAPCRRGQSPRARLRAHRSRRASARYPSPRRAFPSRAATGRDRRRRDEISDSGRGPPSAP